MPIRVDDYNVHVVISVNHASLASVPQLRTTMRDRLTVYPSLVHAVIHDALNRASRGLLIPDPGRDLDVLGARPAEIVQSATASFVRSVFGCAGYWFADKAELIVNSISALPYEGRSRSGRLVIAKADHPAVDVLMKFIEAVDIENTRATRKLLEASGSAADLLSTGEKILGLGRLTAAYDAATEAAFTVSVIARGTWELWHADQVLMTRAGRHSTATETAAKCRLPHRCCRATATRRGPSTASDARRGSRPGTSTAQCSSSPVTQQAKHSG